ncbi:MAG: succinate dehydrogenase [Phycisphaeraceae bacterium]|nr:succinate dehydrogenase [Phycisphaeraceae bacterium]
MTTAATGNTSAESSPALPWAFLLRRLHSLSGIVPVGVFLCEHLFTNAQALRGVHHFDSDVWFIHSLPALRLMEIFGIWLPIAFHAGLGIYYGLVGARPNAVAYPYPDNWRYTLQRFTGYIALIFIFLHLWTVQWGFAIGSWHTPFDAADPAGSTARALQFAWWVLPLYLVGITCAVFHFANGLWTAAITWGLTTSEAAMRRWGYVCIVIGLSLGAMGVGAALRFATYDLDTHVAPTNLPVHIQNEVGVSE